jgi:hypothetical protein
MFPIGNSNFFLTKKLQMLLFLLQNEIKKSYVLTLLRSSLVTLSRRYVVTLSRCHEKYTFVPD